ncbi:microtubule-associated protein tau isoform X2 [Hyalella azteca]|uniref:Microtubule-associated protein n=1 Tax=Hyalella azteca TaxID=294128 RepID=A0A8B7PAJ6_HYAAZ|nr:microtubule-associated protein tau isoform X2 [Hyalella azteca]
MEMSEQSEKYESALIVEKTQEVDGDIQRVEVESKQSLESESLSVMTVKKCEYGSSTKESKEVETNEETSAIETSVTEISSSEVVEHHYEESQALVLTETRNSSDTNAVAAIGEQTQQAVKTADSEEASDSTKKKIATAPRSGGRVSRRRSPTKPSSSRRRISRPEEGHDSGVDETTQSQNGESSSPPKGGRASPRKRQPRSVDPSPMKRLGQPTAASVERKKVPMNKVEVGKSASPNLKQVKSKIGSLDNTTYRPGGGNVKIESKKLDYSRASSRITAKNEEYKPRGGDKKIESQKLKWNAQSKVGSLENTSHKAGGGAKKIETQKLNFKDSAQSKVGSRDNIKHKAGGGDVQIQEQRLDFKEKASSKVGSLKNVTHRPGGGDKKIFDDKEYLRQRSSECGSPCKTPSSVPGSVCSASRPESPAGTNPTSQATSGVTSPQPSES